MSLRFPTIALVVSLLAPALLGAQTQSSAPSQPESVLPASGSEDVNGLKVREIHPRPILSPIRIDQPTSAARALEFRTPEQMTAEDRALADSSQAEIARRANLQGFGLGRLAGGAEQAGWGYEQAVCPVFPDHLILEYSRITGKGDVSLFSAVVPRGTGHVRVIPGQRRGYSLFTPVGANALTINDFNHIVTEEHQGLSQDWLTLGLCYASLAGGHVRAALAAKLPVDEVYPLAVPAMLSVSYKKPGAAVFFADTTPESIRKGWTLHFSAEGRLVKVRQETTPELLFKPVPGAIIEERGTPVNGNVIELPVPKAGN